MDVGFTQTLAYLLGLGKGLKGLKLALDGDLGAGKTYFVRALLEAMEPGLGLQVPSPSFALCNRYVGSEFEIDHFDLYRLEDPQELEETGLFESLDDPGRISLVEWAGKFKGVVPQCNFLLQIEITPTGRAYKIKEIQAN